MASDVIPIRAGDREPTGRVLEIQRMSTEDGPGLRTTVFFKGCSLRCAWCHNPESLESRGQTQWVGSRCLGCRLCLSVCPNGALSMGPKGIEIDRQGCRACGACVEQCPSGALELLGREWTRSALLHELLKDRAYFRTSGGGVTASGGEAALQAPFVRGLFERLRAEGVHTALDTCGQVGSEGLVSILPFCDLVLFDLKEIDAEKHARFTGQGLSVIHRNLRRIVEQMDATGRPAELWIRTPLIPGATATPDNLRGLGAFIARELGGRVARWDLCTFNNLCRDKYTRLGMEWEYRDHDLLTAGFVRHLEQVARQSGVDPDRVRVSGSTRLEETEEGTGSGPRGVPSVKRSC